MSSNRSIPLQAHRMLANSSIAATGNKMFIVSPRSPRGMLSEAVWVVGFFLDKMGKRRTWHWPTAPFSLTELLGNDWLTRMDEGSRRIGSSLETADTPASSHCPKVQLQ